MLSRALRRALPRRTHAARTSRALGAWAPVDAASRRGGAVLPSWEADDGFLAMRAGSISPDDMVYGETRGAAPCRGRRFHAQTSEIGRDAAGERRRLDSRPLDMF